MYYIDITSPETDAGFWTRPFLANLCAAAALTASLMRRSEKRQKMTDRQKREPGETKVKTKVKTKANVSGKRKKEREKGKEERKRK